MNRKTLSKLSGVPSGRIRFYTDRGLINIDVVNTGRGKERSYNRNNLIELLIIKELSQYGVSLKKIKFILAEAKIRSSIFSITADEIWSSLYIFIISDEIIFGHYKEGVKILSRNETSMLFVDVGKILFKVNLLMAKKHKGDK